MTELIIDGWKCDKSGIGRSATSPEDDGWLVHWGPNGLDADCWPPRMQLRIPPDVLRWLTTGIPPGAHCPACKTPVAEPLPPTMKCPGCGVLIVSRIDE